MANGQIDAELEHRMGEARKMARVLKGEWRQRKMSREVKVDRYNSIIVSTALYGSETWTMTERMKQKVYVMEMSCLRRICGVTRMGRVRNEEIRRSCGGGKESEWMRIMVEKIGDVCKRRLLKVNAGKSNVMKVSK